MPSISQKKIKDVVDKIVQKYNPDRVILFGSYAWGTPDFDSDVDLFVIKDTQNSWKLAKEIDASVFPRPFPVDVFVYTPDQVEKRKKSGDFFINDIITKGEILYAK